MRLSLILLILLLSFTLLQAQTPTDTPEFGWKHSLVAGLTLTQIAFTDWVQGGENALACTISADGKSVEDQLTLNWSTSYRFAFGQTRLGSQGLRKTDE